MKKMEIIHYLDRLLDVHRIRDYSLNGLQVDFSGDIKKIAFSVDAGNDVLHAAVEAGADLLVVHHGLLWKQPVKIVGEQYKRLNTCFNGNLGVYAAHLPLDMHNQFGNNAQMAQQLELKEVLPFGHYQGMYIGCFGQLASPIPQDRISNLLENYLNVAPVLHLNGSKMVHTIAMVSGSGSSELIAEAIDKGIDLLLMGENKHALFHDVMDNHLNIGFLGHYASETFGVKALQSHLEERFHVETVFLDFPTLM
jgi:dinuclear metal center YbgI/SA1388 family protein